MPVDESVRIDAARPPDQPIEPVVRVAGVSKTFAVPRHYATTLKERLRHPIVSFTYDRLEALRDVSFEVGAGEFFAVIGRNGSGKSTLLRCIAGIHQPNSGEVEVHGRLAPFIELGVGFHPVLNARDNVNVAGTLMGLRPREARRRIPQVIGFAELEEFADMKLGNYSSGMQARLAFSTAIQVDADVLLFDEVLAVGDALFREKSFDTFERLISSGRTIVYVSHSLETIRRFADRVLLLERGQPVAIGDPEMVIEEYERRNRASGRRGDQLLDEQGGYAEILDAWFDSERGGRTSVLRQGEHAKFGFTVGMRRDMERPAMGFVVRDDQGRPVLSETDHRRRRGRERVVSGEESAFSVRFTNRLEPGAYEAVALLAPSDGAGLRELPGGTVPLTVEPGEARAEPLADHRAVTDTPHGGWPNLRRFAEITLILARTEFKLRYLDSAIGYLWALAQPLLMFAVIYAVVSQVVRFGGRVSDYPLKLLLGIVLFTFFTEAAGSALPSVVAKGAMLRKIPFPALALPLSSVLTSSFVYGFSLVIVVGFVLIAGIAPSPAWLEMVPVLVLLLAFTSGVSLLLSLLYVSVRDVQPIWPVVTRLLFFATPVFFPIEVVPPALQRLMMLNPLAVVIVQARHALIDRSAPTALAAAGSASWLALPVVATLALLGVALWLFQARGRTIAERI